MDTEARWIHDKIRLAEQERIRDGEDRFAGDLADLLTPEQIAEGVSLDFRTDGALFRDTLDILGLHTAIDTGMLHVRRVMNLHRSASHINSAAKPISGQNLHAALAYMQSDQWSTYHEEQYGRTELRTPDFIRSVIVLATPDREHEGYSDLTQPVIILSAQCRYNPAMDSELSGVSPVAGLVRKAHAPNTSAGDRITAFADSLRDEEARLLMPGETFGLEIGMHESAFGWSMTETARIAHEYTVRSGRVVAAEPNGTD